MSAFLYLNVDGEKRMKKKFLKVITTVVTVIIATFLVLVGYLTITEFKPNAVEQLAVEAKGEKTLQINDSISVLTWNIGYGALGDNADFFMDGGKMVYTSDAKRVQENIDAINKEITSLNPDVIMLQEVDGRVPSCRLLNEPYDYDNKDNFQHYLIDGYIVSSNIEVESVKTLNLKFKNADHNPVLLKLKLK